MQTNTPRFPKGQKPADLIYHGAAQRDARPAFTPSPSRQLAMHAFALHVARVAGNIASGFTPAPLGDHKPRYRRERVEGQVDAEHVDCVGCGWNDVYRADFTQEEATRAMTRADRRFREHLVKVAAQERAEREAQAPTPVTETYAADEEIDDADDVYAQWAGEQEKDAHDRAAEHAQRLRVTAHDGVDGLAAYDVWVGDRHIGELEQLSEGGRLHMDDDLWNWVGDIDIRASWETTDDFIAQVLS